jgi:hypothetical protein
MESSGIAKTARRLRWAVWIFWACVVAAYVAGRLGLALGGPVEVKARSSIGETGAPMIVADITILLLSVALYQLNRMLGAIAVGDLFSARVIGAFRAFAFWLLMVAIVWIVAPIVGVLLMGPGEPRRLEFSLQLRDVLTVGTALILFLVARLLERARTLDEEMREIV